MLEMIFSTMTASAYWLSQIAFHIDANEKSETFLPINYIEITFPLSNKIPITLK